MRQEEFDTIVQDRIDHIKATLAAKGKGYAIGGDKLHNFRVAARVQGINMEKALEGMRMKHDVSIMDMVDCPEAVTEEMIVEKIGDRINYDVLLTAIFLERIRAKKSVEKPKVEPKVTPIECLGECSLTKESETEA